ncbi:MAG: diguanylate cyclase [Lachnospiraceae bacterium]|nr:diguanylate cyclase [Lachnospiraceae bacterium]
MKKATSIKQKNLINAVLSILITALMLQSVSLSMISQICKRDAKELITSMTNDNVAKMNAVLYELQDSAEMLHAEAVRALGNDEKVLDDDAFRRNFCEHMGNLLYDALTTTDGAICGYLVFEQYVPYYNDYLAFRKAGNKYVPDTMEIVADYDPSERDCVGWYYETIAAGKASWIKPYYCESLYTTVTSYTIPIYVNHIFVGLVGIDISVEYLQSLASQVEAYDSGHATILDSDNNIIYHPDHPSGAKYEQLNSEQQNLIHLIQSNPYVTTFDILKRPETTVWVGYRTLTNNMIFILTVHDRDVISPIYSLSLRFLLLTALILILSIIITGFFTRKITKPLNELADIAVELGHGNMEIAIPYYRERELNQLAEAFGFMREKITESMAYINGLAYLDLMTGANNKGAFEKDSNGLTATCLESKEDFAVISFDANDLKHINDVYGHMAGDELIKAVAQSIMETFGQRNTYRTGGDEFCVLLRHHTKEQIEEKLEKLEAILSAYSKWHPDQIYEPIVVAYGYSFFCSGEDTNFASVYARADAAMYENKKMKKA